MSARDAVFKDWSLWLTNFDGTKDGRYLFGEKPTGYATLGIVDTDVIDGPLTGGEFNKGAYIRITGYALGRTDKLGQAAGARVFFRDPLGDNAWHEVDNYRYVRLCNGVYATHQLMELCVQIGTLGGGMVTGRALDLKVTVNGVDSNILPGQFTIQPGRFAFADNVSGVDATAVFDDITKPWRIAQKWGGGSVMLELWAPTTSMGEDGLRSGDWLVLRAHVGTPWVDQFGYDNRFLRFRVHTGTPPTGNVGSGHIHITTYPGPKVVGGVGGNAPEIVIFNDPPGGGGFIHGCNTAWAYPNAQSTFVGSIAGTTLTVTNNTGGLSIGKNMYLDPASGVAEGTTILRQLTDLGGGRGTYQVSVSQTLTSRTINVSGFGQYVTVSGDIRVTLNATSVSDSAGVNWQNGANGWRVYGMEVGPWPSTSSPLNGGLSGNGIGIKARFNYVHDIACQTGQTNHGIYFDGSNLCAKNCEASYNRIENITGGTGLENFNQSAGDTLTGNLFHHNFIAFCSKYGINGAQDTTSLTTHTNIIIGCGGAGISFNSQNINQDVRHTHNLIIGCANNNGNPNGCIDNTSRAGVGSSIKFQHNVIIMLAGRTGVQQATTFYSTYSSDSNHAVLLSENHWFDFDVGHAWTQNPPSQDASASTGDPLFTSSADSNYTVKAGSPLLGSSTLAEAVAVLVDFYGIPRPVTGTGTAVAPFNDRGPFQGVGT